MNLHAITKICVLSGLILVTTNAFSDTNEANNVAVSNHAVASDTIKATTPADDAAITQTLKKVIGQSEPLSKLKVDVSTNKGIVTLKGTVDSETEASTLVEYAESIIGVSDVDTANLKVKDSTQPMADTYITAKIKGLFIREKLFGEKDIAAINTSVETRNGVVYLSGLVDNQAQIDNAIDIIKKHVPEVKKVEYSIKKVTPAN